MKKLTGDHIVGIAIVVGVVAWVITCAALVVFGIQTTNEARGEFNMAVDSATPDEMITHLNKYLDATANLAGRTSLMYTSTDHTIEGQRIIVNTYVNRAVELSEQPLNTQNIQMQIAMGNLKETMTDDGNTGTNDLHLIRWCFLHYGYGIFAIITILGMLMSPLLIIGVYLDEMGY